MAREFHITPWRVVDLRPGELDVLVVAVDDMVAAARKASRERRRG